MLTCIFIALQYCIMFALFKCTCWRTHVIHTCEQLTSLFAFLRLARPLATFISRVVSELCKMHRNLSVLAANSAITRIRALRTCLWVGRGRNSSQVCAGRALRLTHAHVTSPLMYNDYVSALLRTRLRANAFLGVAYVYAGRYPRLTAAMPLAKRPAATSTIIDTSKLTRFLSKFSHVREKDYAHRLLSE